MYAVAFAIMAVAMWIVGRWFEVPIVSNLTEISMSIIATWFGVMEAMIGRDYQTWEPARRERE
jgi:hypothetical protein